MYQVKFVAQSNGSVQYGHFWKINDFTKIEENLRRMFLKKSHGERVLGLIIGGKNE
jgi:hypothetical protein